MQQNLACIACLQVDVQNGETQADDRNGQPRGTIDGSQLHDAARQQAAGGPRDAAECPHRVAEIAAYHDRAGTARIGHVATRAEPASSPMRGETFRGGEEKVQAVTATLVDGRARSSVLAYDDSCDDGLVERSDFQKHFQQSRQMQTVSKHRLRSKSRDCNRFEIKERLILFTIHALLLVCSVC